MLASSAQQILDRVGDHDLVLDVGGWGRPFTRADWVIDLMPYDTRGGWGRDGDEPERFTRETWVERDVCSREPWPFEDAQFAFAVCSHTLEDVRDPVWVCSELQRVARAGYIEVPSRLAEQSYGVQGEWAGWSHHHWLVDVADGRVQFVFKTHALNGQERNRFPAGFFDGLSEEERVQTLWWEGSFDHGERVFTSPEELDDYLGGFVERSRGPRRGGMLARLRGS